MMEKAARARGRVAPGGEKALAYVAGLVLLVVPSLFTTWDRATGTLVASSSQGYDFAAYYRAGRAVLDGISPYPAEMLQGPFLLNLRYGFFYPPPFAAAVAPLALLSPFVANAVWIVILSAGILLCGATIAGAGQPRRAEPPMAIMIGLALGLSTPGFSGLVAGNVSPLLGLLALPPLLARRDGLAGPAMAVAALTKIAPAIWGAYLLGAGRIRALILAAVTVLGLAVVTYALPGVRAGWAEYPTVLANSAASERLVEGHLADNLSVAGVLGLPPGTDRLVEMGLFACSGLLMLVAGRYGVRWAPLAAAFGMFSTPSVWLHSCLLVAPVALIVVALGPGLSARGGRVALSGPRLAQVVAVAFLFGSYALLLLGVERLAAFVLVVPLVLAAAALGPGGQATDSGAASFSTSKV
jgi:hypothetical protein